MAKLPLSPILSGYSLDLINTNFVDVADEFQNKVLYRDNPIGEPNSMENDIDMNSNNILNAGVVNATSFTAGGVDPIATAQASADAAAVSETNAATSETNAASSASNAATSETNAAASATAAADAAANGGPFDRVKMTPQASQALLVGEMGYSTDTDSFEMKMDITDQTLQVGHEVIHRVKNTTGSTITNGSVVYISGASGNINLITKAQADARLTSEMIGVATHDIAHNAEGLITLMGDVNSIDTSSFSEGDVVYLDAATAGLFTATKPSAPNYVVKIGHIARAHVTLGTLTVISDIPLDAIDIIYDHGLSGSVATSVEEALQRWPSVTDYGLISGGDSTVNRAALVAMDALGLNFLTVPPGSYAITSPHYMVTPLISFGGIITSDTSTWAAFQETNFVGKTSAGNQGGFLDYKVTNLADHPFTNPNPTAYEYIEEGQQFRLQGINFAGKSQASGATSRTNVSQAYLTFQHLGEGDGYNMSLNGGASQHPETASNTEWGHQNSAGMGGGQWNAITAKVNLYGWGDVVLNDNGHQDVSMFGGVTFLSHSGSDSSDYEIPRIGHLIASTGTSSIDAHHSLRGKSFVGVDCTNGTYASNTAVALEQNQRVSWDAVDGTGSGIFATQDTGTTHTKFDGSSLVDTVANNGIFQRTTNTATVNRGTDSSGFFHVMGASTTAFLSAGQIGTTSYLTALSTAAENTTLKLRTAASGVEADVVTLSSTGDVTADIGDVVIGTSGKGIDFTAASDGTGTVASSILKTTKEGTFTPGLEFGGAAVGMTFGLQEGEFVRNGDWVSGTVTITLTDKGTSTGAATITNLPFTSASATLTGSMQTGFVSGMSGLTSMPHARIGNTQTVANLSDFASTGSTGLDDTNFGNTTSIRMEFGYKAA